MKKSLIILFSLSILMVGCSEESTINNPETKEIDKSKNVITLKESVDKLLYENKRIIEENDFNSFKNIVFEDSPYAHYTHNYVSDEEDGVPANTVTINEFSMVDESDEVAGEYISGVYEATNITLPEELENAKAIVNEHKVINGEESITDSYYIFVKDGDTWKIFDSIVISK